MGAHPSCPNKLISFFLCSEKHDAFPRERRHCHRAQLGKHDGPLLGTFKNFCSAFYHVKETPEALQRESCLRCEASGAPSAAGGGLPKCSGKSVVCLARISTEVDDLKRDVYVARSLHPPLATPHLRCITPPSPISLMLSLHSPSMMFLCLTTLRNLMTLSTPDT